MGILLSTVPFASLEQYQASQVCTVDVGRPLALSFEVEGSRGAGERGCMGRGNVAIWCISIGHVLQRSGMTVRRLRDWTCAYDH